MPLPVRAAGWFASLKLRLMLTSVLVIAVAVTLTTLVVLERVERRSEQAVMDLEHDHAERVASLLAQRVVSLQKMLRATAEQMPPAARTDAAAATAFLQGNPALAASFASVFIAAANGDVIGFWDGTHGQRPLVNLRDREYFSQTLASGVPLVSGPVTGRVSREPIIQLTMPVYADAGRVVAVIGGTLRLATRNLFDDLTYAGNSDGNGGTDRTMTIVTDARGSIISHPQRSRLLRGIDTEPGMAEAVARWVTEGRPIEPSAKTQHDGGWFISMVGVPGADWMVFRLVPDAALLGGIVQGRREALQWAGAVALLGGLITLALVALMLGPLSQLRRRALQLQDGTLALDEGWPGAGGEIGELSCVLQQVLKERLQGEETRHALAQQMGSILAAAPIGIAFTNNRRFELVGAEFCALLGFEKADLLGRLMPEVFASVAEFEALGPRVAAAFAEGRPYFGELQFRRRDGSTFWGRLQGRPVAAEQPSGDVGIIWLLEDVTEHREARERLSWSASHDMLTRLFNRHAFEERLSHWLATPQPAAASLLCMDLDRFKLINDSGGHAAGDNVLRQVASALYEQVRPGDAPARLGGDEFAVLLPGCGAEVALRFGERLRAAVAQIGIDHDGQRLTIGASIGIVELPPDAGSAEGRGVGYWLARADAACYEAKRAGRDTVRLALADSRDSAGTTGTTGSAPPAQQSTALAA